MNCRLEQSGAVVGDAADAGILVTNSDECEVVVHLRDTTHHSSLITLLLTI